MRQVDPANGVPGIVELGGAEFGWRVAGLVALQATAGAAVVTGLGGTNLPGLLLALGALVAEVSFTLVAVPLLAAGGSSYCGPLRAAAYVSGCSIPVLFGLAFATGGAGTRKTGKQKGKDTAAAPRQSRTRTGAPRA